MPNRGILYDGASCRPVLFLHDASMTSGEARRTKKTSGAVSQPQWIRSSKRIHSVLGLAMRRGVTSGTGMSRQVVEGCNIQPVNCRRDTTSYRDHHLELLLQVHATASSNRANPCVLCHASHKEWRDSISVQTSHLSSEHAILSAYSKNFISFQWSLPKEGGRGGGGRKERKREAGETPLPSAPRWSYEVGCWRRARKPLKLKWHGA
ncbi:hypothetical protein VTK73DRAFT_2806 [Phialemonium thermophilum]|uniref:Uncharacterized protein n=1 Tax=Phialemonium thermophilum TaxID=223376 RepID=A0ABR3VNX5_9PEZI